MSKFYHVTINPSPGTPDETVKLTFDRERDWYKYNRNCYLVYTDKPTVIELFESLKPLVEPNGTIVLIKADVSDYWGLESGELWEWLSKDRTPPVSPPATSPTAQQA